ncbi:tetratricopeptide repeat protein [Lentzea sp. BCCO 10_0856]|uniref:Tetratricopeptide repeat protein n=1 Tax=Lentzea miocenica TaxID=3095431 RepID=A0ABU4TFY5_9PSEU|nr:tetratricopeptide repeat protein [Lentzea sp. BCCO 10_0856]MDX8037081.1 tetratricopeptide repeat protein [Lentzea sp. BCCO 10_0856]
MRNVMSGSARQVVQAAEIGVLHLHGERPVPVPFQLPPAPRCFVSRKHELAALNGWPLLVISGPGGVGKTSLALRWLHDRRAEFPDGQLYVDLGAHAPGGPVAPEVVLEWFLHALGVVEVPESLAARQAMFRSVTVGRAFAVLLDNAASAAQVRPLLPAAGTVVVTSRWRLSPLGVDGARFVEVEPLGLQDSVRLLDMIIKGDRTTAEPDAAGELARLCGGLPVALSVVGARLSTRPRRSLGRELSELRDDRLPELDEGASVGSVLDLSYVDLPARQARLYRLCAWLPGPWFGVEVAAAMVGEPVGDVEDALEDLVEKNLLSEIADDRFRYHDMLRTHARSKPDPAREPGLRRVVEWWLAKAVSADLAARPGRQHLGPVYGEAVAADGDPVEWLEQERANLVAAQRCADEHGWPELVWQLCEPMWALFLHRHYYTDWVETHRLAIRAAPACGQPVAAARLGNRLAMAYTNLRRYDEAAAELDAVLAAGLDDQESETTALSMLGRVHLGRGEPDAALRCYRRVLELRLERRRDREIGLARRRIGEALTALGRAGEAIAELEQAEELLTHPVERARVRTFLARACAGAGQVERARSLLDSASDDLRPSPLHRADVFVLLAELAEDPEQVRDHYRSALACHRDPGDPAAVRIRALLDRHEHEPAPDVIPGQATGEQQRESH